MANTCKYYKQQKYVSYDSGNTWQPLNEYRKGALYETDSEDCGYSVVYRWQNVSGEYTCSGCTKYQKTQKYISTAHPKRRQSNTRTAKRRTHDKAVAPTLAVCPNCGAYYVYHTVCPTCGYYRGKVAIKMDEEVAE